MLSKALTLNSSGSDQVFLDHTKDALTPGGTTALGPNQSFKVISVGVSGAGAAIWLRSMMGLPAMPWSDESSRFHQPEFPTSPAITVQTASLTAVTSKTSWSSPTEPSPSMSATSATVCSGSEVNSAIRIGQARGMALG